MNNDLIFTGLLQGLILSFVAYGVMIPFRLLNFSDLSAEGGYPLGGVITTILLIHGCPQNLALIGSAIGAGLLGVATGFVHLRLKVNSLLSGIILSIMIYSVNLRLLSKPNVALFNVSLFFNPNHIFQNILFTALILLIVLIPFIYFLKTDFGLMLRAVGLNPNFAKRQGFSVSGCTLLGLFLGGCFTGISGSLMVQLQQYMDIGMGIGIVIHALAALMLGEVLVGQQSLIRQLLAPLVGALAYQQIQGIALNLGLAPSDLKCFTGALVLGVIAIKQRKLHRINL